MLEVVFDSSEQDLAAACAEGSDAVTTTFEQHE